jgi:hypothetical protein
LTKNLGVQLFVIFIIYLFFQPVVLADKESEPINNASKLQISNTSPEKNKDNNDENIIETLVEMITASQIPTKIQNYLKDYFNITIKVNIGFIGLLLLIFISLIIILFYKLYSQFIVLSLSTNNSQLLKIPLDELPQAQQFLKWTRRLNILNNVRYIGLNEIIRFITLPNLERCKILSKRLGTRQITTSASDIFNLGLNEKFPLNLTNCFLYFPETNLSVQEIIIHLQQNEIAFQTILVISLNPEQQCALHSYGEKISKQYVIPNTDELMALLSSSDPVKAFVTLLATQLKITQISPYQVSEGVNKDFSFFGRTQLLAQILNREPANYLLMGGRQMGKSSVLKYIARHYQNHPNIECHYLVLTGSHIQAKLAKTLRLPFKTDFETLLEELTNVPEDKYRLLLIDEADLFIQAEIENGYPTLSHFRSLSEEGRCFFIFAGFWDLYKAALLNYHSPIKNFGKAVILSALETEACQQLATEPMTMLGIGYESESLVQQIVSKTGQRANLIAIVCDEMLKNLEKLQQVLTAQDVSRALASQAVHGALMGWQQLTDDEPATQLDRIIVYATIEVSEFSLTDMMQLLNNYNYTYTTEQLNQSLARLELAFILQRERNRYRYCVPLFREMLLEQDVQALLKQEFKSIRANQKINSPF